jgi:hypothetical protein
MNFGRKIIFMLALCCGILPAMSQEPTISITSGKAEATLEIDYKITNVSGRSIYIFSPFLQDPFDSELNTGASEILWTTFTPKLRGNYFTKLEFLRIAAGQSYTGHITSAYAAQRLNNCRPSSHLSVSLAIGWAYDTEAAEDEWKKDATETIRIIQRWQTLARSPKYIFDRTQRRDAKQCPPHQPVEIWR